MHEQQARARLEVSRHASGLFWEKGVAATSGDDIASAAGVSTRTIWRYFRSKESCVEPVLAKSAHCFIAVMDRWPPGLSLGEHIAAEVIEHPLTPTDVDDRSARCASPPGRCRRGAAHVVPDGARRNGADLTVRLCAAAVTGAFRVVDEEVSQAIVDKRDVAPEEALGLIDRA